MRRFEERRGGRMKEGGREGGREGGGTREGESFAKVLFQ